MASQPSGIKTMLESAAEAVRQGNVDHLCEILDVCRDAATRPISSFENQTLLHVAAKAGQSRCLEAILTSNEYNLDVKDGSRSGQTALHLAAISGMETCIRLLLQYGANPLLRDELRDYTPRDYAEKNQLESCTRQLLEGEEKYRHRGTEAEKMRKNLSELRDQFEVALRAGKTEKLVDILSKHEKGLMQRLLFYSRLKEETLICTLARMDNISVLSPFLERLGSPPPSPTTGETLLHFACIHCNDLIVCAVYHHFPEMAAVANSDGDTPLHVAVRGRRRDVVRVLLQPCVAVGGGGEGTEAGVDVNAGDGKRRTALHLACLLEAKDIVKVLLIDWPGRVGVFPNVNSLDEYGRTPLHEATWSGDDDVVRLLLNHGADVHARGRPKRRCLEAIRVATAATPPTPTTPTTSRTITRSRTESQTNEEESSGEARADSLSRELVGQSYKNIMMEQEARNGSPNTFRHWAHQSVDSESSGGAGDVETLHRRQVTPLVEACVKGNRVIVELLLKKGATDSSGLALCVALVSERTDIVRLLLTRLNGLRRQAQARPNAIAVRWAGLQLSHFDAQWLTFFESVTSDAKPYTESEALENAVPPAVTLHRLSREEDVDDDIDGTSNERFPVVSHLDLHANQLRDVPIDVFELEHLTYLDLSQNRLHLLPSTVWQCANLTELKLNKNRLTYLPSAVWFLTKLNDLNVAENQLGQLDVADECRIHLERLDVSKNRLTRLPAALFVADSSLTFLKATRNRIRELPPSLWDTLTLNHLDLSHNSIGQLPLPRSSSTSSASSRNDSFLEQSDASVGSDSVIFQQPRSSWVKIEPSAGKAIRSSDDGASELKSIAFNRGLVTSHWHVGGDEVVSASSGEVKKSTRTGLEILDLSHNGLIRIPDGLPCAAPNLVDLDLSHNHIACMGSTKSYPAALQHLRLQNNQIKIIDFEDSSVKDEFVRCWKEPSGGGGGNCRHRKHDWLCDLKSLYLSGNQLERINLTLSAAAGGSFGRRSARSRPTVTTLVGLETQRDLLALPHLSRLDLSDNNLSALPASLGAQEDLKSVYLTKNPDLVELPLELGRLREAIMVLRLDASQMRVPPVDVASSTPRDILTHLYALLRNSVVHRHMKLAVVGYDKRGKTTLLQRLSRVSARKIRSEHVSTKGVALGQWSLSQSLRQKNRDKQPIVFLTYDFAGQVDYYSTHQCFLSEHSLYLIVWKVTHADDVFGLRRWLLDIEARAPGSPVIIVGTHTDCLNSRLMGGLSKDAYLKKMSDMIRDLYVVNRHGLPSIVSIEFVSCTNRMRNGLEELRETIFDVADSLVIQGNRLRNVADLTKQQRGRADFLLRRKIPASFLELQKKVGEAAGELNSKGRDPVIAEAEFETVCNGLFDDKEEMNQAVAFLHRRGIMLHYDEPTLKNFYFLDPQWLGRTLSCVITIKKENPFLVNGLMKREHLEKLFRKGSHVEMYTRLMAIFEVAIPVDETWLLVPSHLPSTVNEAHSLTIDDNENEKTVELGVHDFSIPGASASFSLPESHRQPLNRLWMMAYVPSGFWPRIMCKMSSDRRLVEALLPPNADDNRDVMAGWMKRCRWLRWVDGVQLKWRHRIILQLRQKQTPPEIRYQEANGGVWVPLKLNQGFVKASACIELSVHLSNLYQLARLVVEEHAKTTTAAATATNGEQSRHSTPSSSVRDSYTSDAADSTILVMTRQTSISSLSPSCRGSKMSTASGTDWANRTAARESRRIGAEMLVLVSSHVKRLVDDWYPGLQLDSCVVPIIPCGECFVCPLKPTLVESNVASSATLSASTYVSLTAVKPVKSAAAVAAANDGSGEADSYDMMTDHVDVVVHYMYGMRYDDAVIMASRENPKFQCQCHGEMDLSALAPDLFFADLPSGVVKDYEPKAVLYKEKCLGRGGFGAVFEARLQDANGQTKRVAVKVFSKAKDKDEAVKESAYSITSYAEMRHELAVLVRLNHNHIVSLLGVCRRPLSLVLEYAHKGNLETVVKDFKREKIILGPQTMRRLLLQIAASVSYLHGLRTPIIHRDLKPDNVLVWAFPPPSSEHDASYDIVHVKLADYGISTFAPFGLARDLGDHTARYTAPEILQYGCKASYNASVDVFSYGMLAFFILSGHKPFKDMNGTAADHEIKRGNRPLLSLNEQHCSPGLQDVIISCWQQSADLRPSMEQVETALLQTRFGDIVDVVTVTETETIYGAVMKRDDLWIIGGNKRRGKLTFVSLKEKQVAQISAPIAISYDVTSSRIEAASIVNDTLWMGTLSGHVLVYALSPEDQPGEAALLFFGSLGKPCSVLAIKHSSSNRIVAVSLGDGSLRLYDDQIRRSSSGEALLRTVGCSPCIDPRARSSPAASCMTFLRGRDGTLELWCGLTTSKLAAYRVDVESSSSSSSMSGSLTTTGSLSDCLVKRHVDHLNDCLPDVASQPFNFAVVCGDANEIGGPLLWFSQVRRPYLVCVKYDTEEMSVFDLSLLLSDFVQKNRCFVTAITSRGRDLIVGMEGGSVLIVDSVHVRCVALAKNLYSGKVQFICTKLDEKEQSREYKIVSGGIGWNSLCHQRKIMEVVPQSTDIITWSGGVLDEWNLRDVKDLEMSASLSLAS